MVVLICPVCIVIIPLFSEFVYAHSIAVSVNLVSAKNVLAKYDMETTSNVIM